MTQNFTVEIAHVIIIIIIIMIMIMIIKIIVKKCFTAIFYATIFLEH